MAAHSGTPLMVGIPGLCRHSQWTAWGGGKRTHWRSAWEGTVSGVAELCPPLPWEPGCCCVPGTPLSSPEDPVTLTLVVVGERRVSPAVLPRNTVTRVEDCLLVYCRTLQNSLR